MVKFDMILCYSHDDDNDIGFSTTEASKSKEIFLYYYYTITINTTNCFIFHYKIYTIFFPHISTFKHIFFKLRAKTLIRSNLKVTFEFVIYSSLNQFCLLIFIPEVRLFFFFLVKWV